MVQKAMTVGLCHRHGDDGTLWRAAEPRPTAAPRSTLPLLAVKLEWVDPATRP